MSIQKQPFLYKRQQFLISLVACLKDSPSDTDLQKIVFSYCKKKELNFYDFMPYKFGAFSTLLARDVDYLTDNNFLGKSELENIAIDEASIETLRGNKLVRKTYKEYPFYAINSGIAHEVLSEYDLSIVAQKRQELADDKQILFSVGYEGKSLESFICDLLLKNIKVLCDIRYNPQSRKAGFSQSTLKKVVEGAGIEYVHIPELGIEPKLRISLESESDYVDLFVEYRKTFSNRESAIKRLCDIVINRNRIAIMCLEKDPAFCHRNIVKNYIAENYQINCENL